MAGGRPSEYDTSYCERVIELGKQGASNVEMAFELGVHRDTLFYWADHYEQFSEAFTYARAASQVWWERKGRDNLENTSFKDGMWSRSMAARFPEDWREVKATELTGKAGGPVQTTTALKVSGLSQAALREIAALDVPNEP